MKTSSSPPKSSPEYNNREKLISANSAVLDILYRRVAAKRFRVQEGDSLKLGYIRAYIQALQAQNTILKDVEIDELRKEIAELKEAIKLQSQH